MLILLHTFQVRQHTGMPLLLWIGTGVLAEVPINMHMLLTLLLILTHTKIDHKGRNGGPINIALPYMLSMRDRCAFHFKMCFFFVFPLEFNLFVHWNFLLVKLTGARYEIKSRVSLFRFFLLVHLNCTI